MLLVLTFVGTQAAAQARLVEDRSRITQCLLAIHDALTGEPLTGAQVIDLITGSYVTTEADGTVSLAFVQTQHDSAALHVRKLGYRDSSFIVRMRASDTAGIMLLLDRVALLAPMKSTANWRPDTDDGKWEGFERRCASLHVACLTERDLVAYPAAPVSDMFIHTSESGIHRICAKGTASMCMLNIRDCRPWFWIDGVPYSEHLWEVEQWYGTLQFKGIEIYGPENTPLRYRHDKTRCAVVLWTK